ncbi:serine/arginine repetitive matrix protein 2-like [Lycaon pictus]
MHPVPCSQVPGILAFKSPRCYCQGFGLATVIFSRLCPQPLPCLPASTPFSSTRSQRDLSKTHIWLLPSTPQILPGRPVACRIKPHLCGNGVSRSPRKPIDSLRDSRSLSYSPAERRRPSPQPSPRDQQSSSERGSRRGQRGDSRSPGHKRRKETPSPRPVRHRSSRSP